MDNRRKRTLQRIVFAAGCVFTAAAAARILWVHYQRIQTRRTTSASVLQSALQAARAYKAFMKLKYAVIVIQACCRGHSTRLGRVAAVRSAVVLQSAVKATAALRRMRSARRLCKAATRRAAGHINHVLDLHDRRLKNDGVNEMLSYYVDQHKDLSKLHSLNLVRNILVSVPSDVRRMSRLVQLNMAENTLGSLPDWLGELEHLHVLQLGNNPQLLGDIPRCLSKLTNLETLDLSGTSLTKIPEWMGGLGGLRHLDLGRNKELGKDKEFGEESFDGLSNLESLNLEGIGLQEWPRWLCNLFHLRELRAGDNCDLEDTIEELNVTGLSCLENLYLNGMALHRCPQWVSKLESLQVLQLRRNRVLGRTLESAGLEHLTRLKELGLQGIGMDSSPQWLAGLTMLTSLDLGANWELAPLLYEAPLESLSNLQSLNLAGTYLEKWPEWLWKLSFLETLHLNGNYQLGPGLLDEKMVSLSTGGLGNNLQTLGLSGISLTKCPEWFPRLAALTSLVLCSNCDLGQALNDACIGEMHTLTSLDLSSTGLTSIPGWVDKLDRLQDLRLSCNEGLAVSEVLLFALRDSLTCLDLSKTGLKDCPQSLGELGKLLALNIGGNEELGAGLLHASIKRLTDLTKLDLHQTGLEACPSWVGAFLDLQELNLSGNLGLTDLPPSLGNCSDLTVLNLRGCSSLSTPPQQVCRQGPTHCLQYLRDLQKGYVECRLLKIMLVGNPRAGKSSMLDTMQSGRPCLRPDDDRTVYLATHRFFMSPGALFLCVVDLSKGDCCDEAVKWIEAVQAQAPGSAIVVVATHIDVLDPQGLCLSACLSEADVNKIDKVTIKELSESVFDSLMKIKSAVQSWDEKIFKELREVLQEAEDRIPDQDGLGSVWKELRKSRDDIMHDMLGRPSGNILHPSVAICDDSSGRSDAFEKALFGSKTQSGQAQQLAGIHALMEEREEGHIQSGGQARCWGWERASGGGVKEGRAQSHDRRQGEEAAKALVEGHRQTEGAGQDLRENNDQRNFSHVQRLRKLLVQRPRVLLYAAASFNPSAWGVNALLDALEGLGYDKEVFPHVSRKTPLIYLMFEHCFRQGRDSDSAVSEISDGVSRHAGMANTRLCPQGHPLIMLVAPEQYRCDVCSRMVTIGQSTFACRECNWDLCLACEKGVQPGGAAAQATSEEISGVRVELEWEQIVRQFAEKRCSTGLMDLCARPYVQSNELIAIALQCGIDREEVLRALEFLKTIGSVLYYPEDTVDERLRGHVFTRPQWIIDAIKFVIHERRDEDLNDEMRDLHRRLDVHSRMQLDSLYHHGRLCDRLLRVWLWEKFPREDQDVLISLMRGFRLMHEYTGCMKPGRKWCQVCAREGHCSYVVPAMFERSSLDRRYTQPSQWAPELASGCSAVVRYEYQCSHLEDSFVSELQVEWCSSGGLQLGDRFLAIHVLGQAADGIVMKCEESEFTDETVVVTMIRTDNSGVCVLRVVGWVEFVESSESVKSATTDWPLFNHVAKCIAAAEHRQEGLRLTVSVPCGDSLEERRLLQELETCGRRVTLRSGKSIECAKLLPLRRVLRTSDPPAVPMLTQQHTQALLPHALSLSPFMNLHRVIDASRGASGSNDGSDTHKSQRDTFSQASRSSSNDAQRIQKGTTDAARAVKGAHPPLFDGYIISVKLGSGSQGSVWLAELPNGDNAVIKVSKYWAGAKREYKNLSNVPKGHPNVVSVREIVRQGLEDVGIVMDYIEGESLLQRLNKEKFHGLGREGNFTGHVVRACWLMCDVLSGISALHSLEPPIVHRDIKPANIMLRSSDNSAVVVDLGVSKQYGVDDQSISDGKSIKGTLAYASPEVVMGGGDGDVDQRADVWSCGVMLYEILAGERPFSAMNEYKLIEVIKIDEMPQLVLAGKRRSLGKHVVGKFLRKALCKDRAGRFTDAAHMLSVMAMIRDSPSVVPAELMVSPGGAVHERVINFRKASWRVVFFSCRCGTDIVPERESQEHKDLIRMYDKVFAFDSHPMPEIKHFTNELRDIQSRPPSEKQILHFSGHGSDTTGGMYWWSEARKKVKGNQVTGENLANLIRINDRDDLLQRIECFFLNACSTLATGRALSSIGVRVIVCWRTTIKQSVGRAFAKRFYETLSEWPGDYNLAFETVCNEQTSSLAQSAAEPCILHGDASAGMISGHVWCCNDGVGKMMPLDEMATHFGEQVSTHGATPVASNIVESESHNSEENTSTIRGPAEALRLIASAQDAEELCSSHAQTLTITPALSDDSEEESDSEEFGSEEEDPLKNWIPPSSPLHFAKHSGRAEMSIFTSLDFDLSTIVLDDRGMVTPKSCKEVLGCTYGQLWGASGHIVTIVKRILTVSIDVSETCRVCKKSTDVLEDPDETCWHNASQCTIEKLQRTLRSLHECMYYRQLDILSFRMAKQDVFTRQQWPLKKTLEMCKRTQLKRTLRVVMQDLYDDVRDRAALKDGKALFAGRQQELLSDCGSHAFQLQVRLEAFHEIYRLLHRLRLHQALGEICQNHWILTSW